MSKINYARATFVAQITFLVALLFIPLAVSAAKKVELKPTDAELISSIYKNSEIVVTIIGDGSKTSLQVIDTKMLTTLDIEYEGIATKTLVSGSANISNVGFPEAQANLDDLLRRLSISKIGPSKRGLKDLASKGIISGIAGLVANADKKPNIMDLFARYGFDASKVYLAGDVDLAKQLIGDEGAILISGTGSICFSKVSGEEKRVGGFGYIIGDQGSGFYIGKLALEAALESHFEKTAPFVLTGKLCEIFGIASINEAIKLLYTDKTIAPGDVAKTFPFVFDAAFNQNDARCKLIIEQAAAELANQVSRAVKGSSKPNFQIYLIGDVFKTEQADLFIDMIRQRVNYSPGLSLINVAQENIAMQIMASQAKG